MKNLLSLLGKLILASSLLQSSYSMGAETTSPEGLPTLAAGMIGEVTFLLGQAEVTLPEGKVLPLKKAMEIPDGSRVMVKARSKLHLRLADGGLEKLGMPGEDTAFQFNKYLFDPANPKVGEIRKTLLNGEVSSKTGLGGEEARDRYRLNTPLAAIAVLGTEYTVRVVQGQTWVTVSSGEISIAKLGGDCQRSGLGACANDERLSEYQSGLALVVNVDQPRPVFVPASSIPGAPNAAATSNQSAQADAKEESSGKTASSDEKLTDKTDTDKATHKGKDKSTDGNGKDGEKSSGDKRVDATNGKASTDKTAGQSPDGGKPTDNAGKKSSGDDKVVDNAEKKSTSNSKEADKADEKSSAEKDARLKEKTTDKTAVAPKETDKTSQSTTTADKTSKTATATDASVKPKTVVVDERDLLSVELANTTTESKDSKLAATSSLPVIASNTASPGSNVTPESKQLPSSTTTAVPATVALASTPASSTSLESKQPLSEPAAPATTSAALSANTNATLESASPTLLVSPGSNPVAGATVSGGVAPVEVAAPLAAASEGLLESSKSNATLTTDTGEVVAAVTPAPVKESPVVDTSTLPVVRWGKYDPATSVDGSTTLGDQVSSQYEQLVKSATSDYVIERQRSASAVLPEQRDVSLTLGTYEANINHAGTGVKTPATVNDAHLTFSSTRNTFDTGFTLTSPVYSGNITATGTFSNIDGTFKDDGSQPQTQLSGALGVVGDAVGAAYIFNHQIDPLLNADGVLNWSGTLALPTSEAAPVAPVTPAASVAPAGSAVAD